MRREPTRTLGVEEEFHLVDLKTRRLTARAPELLAELSDDYVAELQRCVVETNSRVVNTLDGLRTELVDHRRVLVDTAANSASVWSRRAPCRCRCPPRCRSPRPPATARCWPTTSCWPASSSSAARRCTSESTTATRPSWSASGRPVSAHTVGAVHQLAVLVGWFRHRLLERAHAGLAALADDRAGRAGGVGRRIRRAGQRPDRQRSHHRRGDGLLRRPAVDVRADPGAAGVRQLPVRRHDRADRRAVPGAGRARGRGRGRARRRR